MQDLSPEKVARIIIRAREFDAQTAPWDEGADEDEIESILETSSNDPIAAELKSYIDDLNDDEQTELVALMWVGRGTYEVEEFEDAKSTARTERVNKTSTYLMGTPMLSDHLEAGLEKFGYDVSDLEDSVS